MFFGNMACNYSEIWIIIVYFRQFGFNLFGNIQLLTQTLQILLPYPIYFVSTQSKLQV